MTKKKKEEEKPPERYVLRPSGIPFSSSTTGYIGGYPDINLQNTVKDMKNKVDAAEKQASEADHLSKALILREAGERGKPCMVSLPSGSQLKNMTKWPLKKRKHVG